MDRQQFEMLMMLTTTIAFLLGGLVAWLVLPWLTQQQMIIAAGIVGFALLLVAFRLSLFFHSYIISPRRLADELKIILESNAAYRVEFRGPKDMQGLAESINALADRFQTLTDNQAHEISQARADLEEEKNRLATLMSELTEGVLVCNVEGRILLYNNLAKQLLSQKQGDPNLGGFVGLGRSIFALIDRNVINHALEELAYRRTKQNSHLVTQFVTSATNGQLIRARVASVFTAQDELNGFILTIEDVTQRNELTSRRDRLLQSLTEGLRASLGNIRAAIETLETFPDMEREKVIQLRQVIYNEALTLSTKLNSVTAEHDADLRSDWQLERMLGSDLLWALQNRFSGRRHLQTTIDAPEEDLWLKVDSYAIMRGLTFIMSQLNEQFNVQEITLQLKRTGQLAALDLVWQNGQLDVDTLWAWQNEPLSDPDSNSSLTLREIAEYHGGEIWSQSDKTSHIAYFRLLLPITTQKTTAPTVQVTQQSRPEYYDFDLFRQAGQTAELDQRLLTDLSYTMFDTETTGLNPSQGDEIISISAIRSVNGRLLRQEVFDQLVDPRRHLPPEATAIHHITPEMVVGQPTIEQVLPVFYRFTENTILVAHNAAFDMRMLQMKEAKTGIKFTQPVLDTLLLSAVLHPHYDDHSIDAIAQRLGIKVIGRHTSLGDAIVTGEVFLRLIPLLADKGIHTLAQAREAAQKSYLARLQY